MQSQRYSYRQPAEKESDELRYTIVSSYDESNGKRANNETKTDVLVKLEENINRLELEHQRVSIFIDIMLLQRLESFKNRQSTQENSMRHERWD